MLISNVTYQRETLSERPIRQPLTWHGVHYRIWSRWNQCYVWWYIACLLLIYESDISRYYTATAGNLLFVFLLFLYPLAISFHGSHLSLGLIFPKSCPQYVG